MDTIGKRVFEQRNKIGMTQEELAAKLGYKHKTSINKIELGFSDIPRKKLPAFAEALRCSVNYLVNGEQSIEQMIADAEFDAYVSSDPEIKNMIKKFVALPIDKKQAVKDLVERLFNEFFNGK